MVALTVEESNADLLSVYAHIKVIKIKENNTLHH